MKEKNHCKKCGAEKSKYSQCKCSRGYIIVPPMTANTDDDRPYYPYYVAFLDAFGSPVLTTMKINHGSEAPKEL